MRGLTQFIADIRASRVKELEEKRINKEMAHIRKKFKDGQLDGYQQKKYLSKIVFTYILGYKVDIGHMEAVNLISSSKYSEKQIGYLAVTLLMHENSDFLRLVTNSIRKDLDSNNEINNCLALHTIANVGGQEMAEALAPDVYRLLISPTSQSFVKKKAALTLLRLYRKHPDVIPATEWALRIVSIMDDLDLGVVVCVTSLVMAMAQDNLDAYSICYTKSVDRLHKLVIDKEVPMEYVYYKVPTPWLQVKLLRLLQYYPPSEDGAVRTAIHQVLQAIIASSSEQHKNIQHNNAQNAVLFEAIGLAIHLDAKSPLVASASALLARFIMSKETNVRYLGLDTMAYLAARADSLEPIKKHQHTIILSLRDRDISVRRRALDLLYSMCDTTNAELIVGELLRYLKVADYGLREEMVLKIAISTEKYATSYKWYIDTILDLISSAGDHVGEEVWYRVVQITTNTEDLQEYAAKVVFEHLKSPSCHESLIKVAGYVLGEYGHLIANEAGYSPVEQLQALQGKAHFSSAQTRALLLSTYIKWVNVFPEIKPQLVNIFERYRHVLDTELQQRACEYLAIAQREEGDELLPRICEEMPPFPERESALLTRLHSKHGDTNDKRTWIIGGKEANDDRQAVGALGGKLGTIRRPTRVHGGTLPPPPDASAVPDLMSDGGTSTTTDDIMGSLAGLNMSSETPAVSAAPQPTAPASSTPSVPIGATEFDHNIAIDRWFERLTYTNDGVLFEDVQLQIGIKSEYHGHLGRVALYFGNKMPTPLTSFTATIDGVDSSALSVTFTKIPQTLIHPTSQSQQLLHVECKNVFSAPPVLAVSFVAGSLQTHRIRLPILLSKFFEPVRLSPEDFFERWKLIGGAPREAQMIFPIKLIGLGGSEDSIDVAKQRKVVSGARFQVLDGVDPNASNTVAAGVLHMSTGGKVGCLVRVEPNREAKLCRLTVRSTSELVSADVLAVLSKPLNADTAAS